MSTTGPFDTGYVGAHRWHVDIDRNTYVWTCVCGDTGRVTGNLAFCQECFARHAHEKLQKAAVALLSALVGTPTQELIATLHMRIPRLRSQGDNDQANLLQLVANQMEEGS
jgi:hypothetical protein